MHDNIANTEQRIVRSLASRIRPSILAYRHPCSVAAFRAGDQVPISDGLAAVYEPIAPGTPWGAPWTTTWFEVSAEIPAEWHDQHLEVVVDLGFNDRRPGFQAEALAFDTAGTPIKAINPDNRWLPVGAKELESGRFVAYLEAVAMPAIMGKRDREFLPTPLGDLATAGSQPLYVFGGADLVVVDDAAFDLALDVEVLSGLLGELGERDPRRHEILRALERCLDDYDLAGDPAKAQQWLRPVLEAPAARTAERISAVGHAHIDSAWLWPVRETIRKCARTFANVAALGEHYPELVFACSQAQQWSWMKEHYPTIFEAMKSQVRNGQVVPVGGMWVESDVNVTGGESLVRQLVFGKRFFLDELGVETEEVWLPDAFGYTAALPQLILLSGSRYFLTQKLSWNDTNRFPHHSFWWEGIDGSRVFAHFPPVNTYNSDLSPQELARAARNFAELGHATRSLIPFGYGDGGGGPTREMLERARRQHDLDGSPRLTIEPPSGFFAAAVAEYPDAPVWSGELYLEFHRGTLTSQVEVKQGNHRCEQLLREAELWSTAAQLAGAAAYPYDELEDCWREVLLDQFHDILPGSSIAMVNDEAVAGLSRVAERLEALIDSALGALCGPGTRRLVANAAPLAQHAVPAFSVKPSARPLGSASATKDRLENERLEVTLGETGHVVSLIDRFAGREVVPHGEHCNVLQLHPDVPNGWPAWDIDLFYRHSHEDLGPPVNVSVVSAGPEEAAVRLEYRFGDSSLAQTLRLAAGSELLVVDVEVDWQEEERLLKVAFPLDVHAEQSTAGIQFGHLQRPTHSNTSWDYARFEAVAHRFLHVGEPGYGVAVINAGIYGHEVTAIARRGGGRATLARLSLQRGPRFPDPRAERGVHRFRYAIAPGATIADAVRHGYQLSLPLREVIGERELEPLFLLDNDAVVVEAVKAAEDRSGDVIVRCYESLGGRASATLRTAFPLQTAEITDLLERPLDELEVEGGTGVAFDLRPFEILTLRLSPQRRD